MKTKKIVCVMLIVTLIFLMWPVPAMADDYEEYLSSKKLLEGYAKGIEEAQSEAARAIYATTTATPGDPGPWRDLEKKINYYKEIVSTNLPSMDTHVDAMLRHAPSERLPDISVPPLIEDALNTARERRGQIKRAIGEIDRRILDFDQRINKFNNAILRANARLFTETIDDTVPDTNELFGEAGVAFLGSVGTILSMNPLFLGAAMTATGAVLAFNGMVNLYYNASSLAEQAKVFVDMMKLLQERKRYFQELKDSLKPALDEMDAIVQALETGKKTIDGIREDVKKTVDGWREKAENANKAKAEAERTKLLANINKPKPPLTFRQNYYYYGMDPVPPINTSDYFSTAKSLMDQLESACLAVEEGGEPHTYMEISWSIFYSLAEEYKQKRKAYDQAVESYNQGYKACAAATDAAYQRAWAADQALHARRLPWNEYIRALRAIWDAYNTACQAALNALKPYGVALREPFRNVIINSLINDAVYQYYSLCYYRITDTIQFRTSQFGQLYRTMENRFQEAEAIALAATKPIPETWLTTSWRERTANIDNYVEKALKEGANPFQLKESLLNTAETIQETGKTVKDTIKEYNRVIPQVYLAANIGKADIEKYITMWGKLINHEGIGRHWIPYLGWDRPAEYPGVPVPQEERLKYINEMLDKSFVVYEPEKVKTAREADWKDMASKFRAKAQELDFYIDWINKYEHQKSIASARIDKISKDITGKGLYEAHGGTPEEVLKKEFSEAPWSGLAAQAEKYAPAEQFNKLSRAAGQPWASISVSQKLYAGQNILLERLRTEAKYYMDTRSAGGFMPVQPSIIDPLIAEWKGLRSLCEQYEALSKPIADKIGDAAEIIAKEAAPVYETYNKMPAVSRNVVSGAHRHFTNVVSWLQQYLATKKEWTKSILAPPYNSGTARLDNLLAEYGPLLAKYREQQEQQRRMFEEMKKQAEEREKQEQERQRLEREKTAQKEKDELQSVKDLYKKFKEAYENRNEPLAMSFISDKWQAGDGTTLDSLNKYLRDSFTVFNQIRYDITNLQVTKTGEGLYTTSYDLKITGRILDLNIKHEEKSQVNEEVSVDGKGRARIVRTVTGRFWYVK